MNKPIDEMAKLLRDEKYGIEVLCNESCKECFCLQKQYAERLYNAGFRKASEVAREIFEEIEERLLSSFPPQAFICEPRETRKKIFDMIDELKKKYTEGEG